MIQDKIFALGSIGLIAGLIPAVLGSGHVPVWTALLTGSVLAVYALTYRSLGMRWACATVGIQSVLWAIVLAQSI